MTLIPNPVSPLRVPRSGSTLFFDARPCTPPTPKPANQPPSQELHPSHLNMISEPLPAKKNVVELLRQEQQELLTLINDTKIILKDLIAKQHTCTQEYFDAFF